MFGDWIWEWGYRGEGFPFQGSINTSGGVVPGLESNSVGWRIWGDGEIVIFDIPEERIGDERVAVIAGGLPLSERLADEIERLAIGLPVEVVVDMHLGTGFPSAVSQKLAPIPVDDVVGEGKGEVGF